MHASWTSVAVALFASAMLAGAVGCASLSESDATVAFTSDRNGCCEIYVMDRNGSHIRQVTDTKGHSPSWSPDGQSIVFVHWTRGCCGGERDQEIYVVTANGHDQRRLTRNTVRDDDPAWSPDGRSIAFVRGDDWDSDIYVMDADGDTQRRLTSSKAADLDPTWSPDGRRIAFVRQSRGWSSLYVMDADGTNAHIVKEIATTIDSPTWSPNGRWIAFRQHKAIYRMRPDGTRLEKLFEGENWIWQIAWSSDGREIAFVWVLNGGLVGPDFHEIYALDVAHRTKRQITSAKGDSEPGWRPLMTRG